MSTIKKMTVETRDAVFTEALKAPNSRTISSGLSEADGKYLATVSDDAEFSAILCVESNKSGKLVNWVLPILACEMNGKVYDLNEGGSNLVVSKELLGKLKPAEQVYLEVKGGRIVSFSFATQDDGTQDDGTQDDGTQEVEITAEYINSLGMEAIKALATENSITVNG